MRTRSAKSCGALIAATANLRNYRERSGCDFLTFPILELEIRELAWVLRATQDPKRLTGAASLFIPGLEMSLYGSTGVAYITELDSVSGTEENRCSYTTGWNRGSEENAGISSWDLEEAAQQTHIGNELARRGVEKYNRTGKTLSHNEVSTPGTDPVAVFTSSYSKEAVKFLEEVRKATGNSFLPLVYLVSKQGKSGKQYPDIYAEQRKLPHVNWAEITHARETAERKTVYDRGSYY